jgi:hypothetical protein
MQLRYPVGYKGSTFFTINIFKIGGKSLTDLTKSSTRDDFRPDYKQNGSIVLPPPNSGLGENYMLNFSEVRTTSVDLNYAGLVQHAGKVALESAYSYDMASLSTGTIIDPNVTPLFKGVNLRVLTLTWDLMPRSQKDSDTVSEIISTLRSSILPSRQGFEKSQALSFPDAFGLKFTTPSNSDTFDYLKPATEANWVCENMSVTYNGGSTWSSFLNGEPTMVTITLSMREMTKSLSAQSKRIGGFERLKAVGKLFSSDNNDVVNPPSAKDSAAAGANVDNSNDTPGVNFPI